METQDQNTLAVPGAMPLQQSQPVTQSQPKPTMKRGQWLRNRLNSLYSDPVYSKASSDVQKYYKDKAYDKWVVPYYKHIGEKPMSKDTFISGGQDPAVRERIAVETLANKSEREELTVLKTSSKFLSGVSNILNFVASFDPLLLPSQRQDVQKVLSTSENYYDKQAQDLEDRIQDKGGHDLATKVTALGTNMVFFEASGGSSAANALRITNPAFVKAVTPTIKTLWNGAITGTLWGATTGSKASELPDDAATFALADLGLSKASSVFFKLFNKFVDRGLVTQTVQEAANDLVEGKGVTKPKVEDIVKGGGEINKQASKAAVAKMLNEIAEKIEPQTTKSTKLPHDIAGSKPRYGYGQKLFQLKFEDDRDLALYTIAQETKNKAHDRFMSYLKEQFPNKSEFELIQMGKKVRQNIKEAARTGDPEQVLSVKKSFKEGAYKKLSPEQQKAILMRLTMVGKQSTEFTLDNMFNGDILRDGEEQMRSVVPAAAKIQNEIDQVIQSHGVDPTEAKLATKLPRHETHIDSPLQHISARISFLRNQVKNAEKNDLIMGEVDTLREALSQEQALLKEARAKRDVMKKGQTARSVGNADDASHRASYEQARQEFQQQNPGEDYTKFSNLSKIMKRADELQRMGGISRYQQAKYTVEQTKKEIMVKVRNVFSQPRNTTEDTIKQILSVRKILNSFETNETDPLLKAEAKAIQLNMAKEVNARTVDIPEDGAQKYKHLPKDFIEKYVSQIEEALNSYEAKTKIIMEK